MTTVPTGENSLLGVWNHTNPVEDGEGSWIFEIRRPLQTGDENDAQLEVGGASSGMAWPTGIRTSARTVGRRTAMPRVPTRAGSR